MLRGSQDDPLPLLQTARRGATGPPEGTGGRAAAVRLPATACLASRRGSCPEPQKDPALSRRGSDSSQAQGPQARDRIAGADSGRGQTQRPWSLDFVHDQLSNGRRLRILNVIDDVAKECLAAVADTSISGRRVVRKIRIATAIKRAAADRVAAFIPPGGVDVQNTAKAPWQCLLTREQKRATWRAARHGFVRLRKEPLRRQVVSLARRARPYRSRRYPALQWLPWLFPIPPLDWPKCRQFLDAVRRDHAH